MKLNLIL